MSTAARQASGAPSDAPDRPEAAGVLASERDAVLDDLTALAARLLTAPTASLALVDGERWSRVAATGADPGAGREPPAETGLCRHVVAEGAPVLVGDTSSDLRTRHDPWVAELGLRAWAGVPVVGDDGLVLGVLSVADTDVRTWASQDLSALAVLADAVSAHVARRAAAAAERALRLELEAARGAVERSQQRLDRLARTAMELAATESGEHLIEAVINRALPVLGVDGGALIIRDEHRFRLFASDRLGPHVQLVYGDLPLDSPLPVCHTARTGQRLVLANKGEGLAFSSDMPQVYEDTQRLSWVFVPLELRGELLGSLAVCWVDERDEVPLDELELIDAFAAQCATAVHRLRTAREGDEREQRSARRRRRAEVALRSQARVLELIAGGAPVDVVLDTLALWVQQTLEDGACAVLLVEPHPELGPVLRVAASPGLPPAYRQAVDGTPLTSAALPCAIATTTGVAVIVPDVLADVRWQRMHPLARELDVRATWSFPVRSPATGETLGTLVLHRESSGSPDEATAALVERASHLVGITLDRHRLVTDLDHQARHDALTGLPNRFELIQRLEAVLLLSEAGAGPAPVVVFLDLDRLKVVNDSLGHQTGDVLLVDVARRLSAAVPGDLVARFGGDEFVVLSARPHVDVDALVASVLDALAEPLLLEGRLITPAASAGVLVATPGQSATDVLRDADIAMYRAKAAGGGGYALFGQQMRQRAFDRLDLETQVRHALRHDEFRVHYQPIVDLGSGRIVGFEALVRWQHPQRGLLGPGDFLALAEETGLVVPLGAWVLRTAVATARRWSQVHDTGGLTMSVNLTAQQLHIAGLADVVRECAREIAPWALGLELTESTLMDDTAAVAGVVSALAASGAHLHIDDFGTGFSSLSYLTRLPIRRLKIDGSFVADLERKPEATTVVAAIIGLAADLGLSVVAEGIETAEQRDRLLAMGCRNGQGYLLGPPLPEDDALALLTGR